jgi:multidrug efflux pump subunit AcrA (membrane-fusion protein)
MTQYATETIRPASQSELVDQLVHFDGPPEQFLQQLLGVQCELAEAESGAILRLGPQGAQVVAAHPAWREDEPMPVWLARASESTPRLLREKQTMVLPLKEAEELYDQPASRHLVLTPLRGAGAIRGAAAFLIQSRDRDRLLRSRERIELTVSLLSLYEMRLTLQQRNRAMQRLKQALSTLATINEHERFRAAGMALCNELAAQFQAARVSLGFRAGRYVKVRAISHTEKFVRKMKLVQDLESAMEECYDQDEEIVYPSSPEAGYVCRASRELAMRHGSPSICSVPLRKGGQPEAVLTVERDEARPFSAEEVEQLRLTADLCSARLVELHEHDRWFGARLAAGSRKGLAKLVGPEHTWMKLTAVLVLAGVLFLTLARGADRVESSFSVEAVRQQVIPAPFDGYLAAAHAEPNDLVTAGETVLAELDTAELRLQLSEAQAELAGHLKQADIAMREGKQVEVQIAQADADRLAARIERLRYQLAHATITCPIDGVVLSGDLKKKVGGPVSKGDVLYEVAPLSALRAVLMVPEDRINDVEVGDRGHLASASNPGLYVPFEVERISPIAKVVEQANVFPVRVKLRDENAQLRPGMEGVAKIEVGERSYAWIWTRDLVNWVRMKLWI